MKHHTIDRKAFFDGVRARFGGLNQKQVDTCNAILSLWEARYTERTPLTQLGYCFGTAWHESRLQPIHEVGGTAYFTRMYDVTGARPKVAAQLGNTVPGDGAKYHGRALVQLTGRANYEKATIKLRALGLIGPNADLVANPDLALIPSIAVALLLEGMEGGWYTGKDLDDYVDAIDDKGDADEHADYLQARRIINGTDRAALIAGYSVKFLAALSAACRAPAPPPPPDIPAPRVAANDNSTPTQPASRGLFAALAQLLRRVA